jgi:aldehyde:ferredoxin oxidoreductase
VKKLFNVRERWQPEDDWLPERLLSEALPTGVGSGVGLSRDELRDMLGGYYEARQWNERGFVPEWKIQELGIAAAPKEGHRCPATRPAAS